jgi:hypothetical protein
MTRETERLRRAKDEAKEIVKKKHPNLFQGQRLTKFGEDSVDLTPKVRASSLSPDAP